MDELMSAQVEDALFVLSIGLGIICSLFVIVMLLCT